MIFFAEACLIALFGAVTAQEVGSLTTRWGVRRSPETHHHEYPRPLMVRRNWTNLNGEWHFNIAPPAATPPPRSSFEQRIMVPFPVESKLSGIQQPVGPGLAAWYYTTFNASVDGERLILHFGAVNWKARVWVNNTLVGEHTGGYDPFSFDITDALESGEASNLHSLVVECVNPVDAGDQPRGKQVLKPEGIWYTPSTGIWQTVWFEKVPPIYIKELRIDSSNMNGTVTIHPILEGSERFLTIDVEVKDNGRKHHHIVPAGAPVTIQLSDPLLWSPERPNLYQIRVFLRDPLERIIDRVKGYFGIREIGVTTTEDGYQKFTLNGEPFFPLGPLDQGFWPDGLYTAPSHTAMLYDLRVTKALGFNCVRKHVKVEPATWYAACDQLGLAVLQDMPNGDPKIDPDTAKQVFRSELTRMVTHLRYFPSIIIWVPFNEGWGQHDTIATTHFLEDLDPTRLVDDASGWVDEGAGQIRDCHSYPNPWVPDDTFPGVKFCGEFGGIGYPIQGHTWSTDGWGYQTFQTKREFTGRFLELMEMVRELRESKGLAGAIFTQTTDVETELNGLLTYDRAILKIDKGKAKRAILGAMGGTQIDDGSDDA